MSGVVPCAEVVRPGTIGFDGPGVVRVHVAGCAIVVRIN